MHSAEHWDPFEDPADNPPTCLFDFADLEAGEQRRRLAAEFADPVLGAPDSQGYVPLRPAPVAPEKPKDKERPPVARVQESPKPAGPAVPAALALRRRWWINAEAFVELLISMRRDFVGGREYMQGLWRLLEDPPRGQEPFTGGDHLTFDDFAAALLCDTQDALRPKPGSLGEEARLAILLQRLEGFVISETANLNEQYDKGALKPSTQALSPGSCALVRADLPFFNCRGSEKEASWSYVQLVRVDVFDAALPDASGRLRINIPFAGRFAEREQWVRFLREEVLNKRDDIHEISLFVTDVNDFYNSSCASIVMLALASRYHGPPQSGDPQIFIHYAVQDGRVPLPSADVVMAMHPDCSSSYLTSFGGAYQAHYYMWQHILQNAMNSAPLESLEVQQVARAQGMVVSAALKNRTYHGWTVTAPLTSNVRDRQPFHYLVIAQKVPAKVVLSITPGQEDYAGGNQWTMASQQYWQQPSPWQYPPPAWTAPSYPASYGAFPPPHAYQTPYYKPPEAHFHQPSRHPQELGRASDTRSSLLVRLHTRHLTAGQQHGTWSSHCGPGLPIEALDFKDWSQNPDVFGKSSWRAAAATKAFSQTRPGSSAFPMGGFGSGQRYLLFVGLPLALYCSDCPHLYQILQRMRGLSTREGSLLTTANLRATLDHDGRPYSVLIYALVAALQALETTRSSMGSNAGLGLEPLAPKGGALIFRGLWVSEVIDEHWAEHAWSFNSFSRSVEGVLSVLGFYASAKGSTAQDLAMKDTHILILAARFRGEAGGGRWAYPVQLFAGGENAFPASIEEEVLVPPFTRYYFEPDTEVSSAQTPEERSRSLAFWPPRVKVAQACDERTMGSTFRRGKLRYFALCCVFGSLLGGGLSASAPPAWWRQGRPRRRLGSKAEAELLSQLAVLLMPDQPIAEAFRDFPCRRGSDWGTNKLCPDLSLHGVLQATDAALFIEYDGYFRHMSPSGLARDMRKTRALLRFAPKGSVVVRIAHEKREWKDKSSQIVVPCWHPEHTPSLVKALKQAVTSLLRCCSAKLLPKTASRLEGFAAGRLDREARVFAKDADLIGMSNCSSSLQVQEFLQRALHVTSAQAEKSIERYPQMFRRHVDDHVKPTVEWIKGLGLSQSQVAKVILGRPHVLGLSIEANLKPTVEWIKGLGLSQSQVAKGILGHPQMLGYSIEANLKPTVEWIKGLGLSQSQVAKVILGRPQVLGLSLEANLKPTVEWIKGLGLSQSQVAKVILGRPHVLGYSIVANLKPTVEWIKGLGLSQLQVAKVIATFPQMLGLSIEANLKPTVEWIKGLGLSQSQVAKVIATFPQVLGLSIEANLKPTVEWIKRLGLSQSQVAKVIATFPQMLGFSSEANLKPTVEWIKGLGLSQSQVAKVILGRPHVLGYSIEANLKPTVEWIKGLGLSQSQVAKVIATFPHVLGYSIEANLKPTVERIKGLGLSQSQLAKVIATFPQVLGLSIEANLKPTVEWIKGLGLSQSQLAKVIASFPQVLGYSIEANLKVKHCLLQKYLREEKAAIILLSRTPRLWSYSQARLQRRLDVLKSQGQLSKLAGAMAMSLDTFNRRFPQPSSRNDRACGAK
eukprot:s540_g1.t1